MRSKVPRQPGIKCAVQTLHERYMMGTSALTRGERIWVEGLYWSQWAAAMPCAPVSAGRECVRSKGPEGCTEKETDEEPHEGTDEDPDEEPDEDKGREQRKKNERGRQQQVERGETGESVIKGVKGNCGAAVGSARTPVATASQCSMQPYT